MPPGRLVVKPVPKASPCADAERKAVEPHVLPQRPRLAARIGDERGRMILQVLADAAQRHFRLDAVRAQFVRIADAGQHQGLRRIDRAARQDHLALRARDLALAVLQIFDADGARALEQDARHQRAGLDPQIGAPERGPQIADRRAAAMAVADRHLDAREAVLLGAVVVGGRRMPGVAPGFEIGIDQRVGVARGLDGQRPVAAAIRIRAAFPSSPAAGSKEARPHRTSPAVRTPPSGRSRRDARAHRPSR